MSYKFGADEPVRAAIVRTAREQLDRAISELSEGITDHPVEAVHTARKAIKKERSLLRLARGTLSGEQRQSENAALREAARGLSGTRDADVMISSLDQLAERFVGQLPATTFGAIRDHLDARRHGEGGPATSVLSTQAVQALNAVRNRVDNWELDKGGWKAIAGGLHRSYRHGCQALTRAQATSETEDLHTLRKRVKDLWYHERLLAPTCGETVNGHVKELHRLADLLGDDHDLGVLKQELSGDPVPVPVDVAAVVKLIDHRRTELQDEALRLAHRAYAEPPKAFSRRMRESWKAGRALARAPRDQHPAELAAATRQPS